MKDTSQPLHPDEKNPLSTEDALHEQQLASTRLPLEEDACKTTLPFEEEQQTIPVVEEQLDVTKQVVKTGTVRVIKDVATEEVVVDTSYTTREVHVEHVHVGRTLEDDEPTPTTRTVGDVTIVPIVREVEEVVVRKRRILVEEIHLQHQTVDHTDEEKVVLQRHVARIERKGQEERPTPTNNEHSTS